MNNLKCLNPLLKLLAMGGLLLIAVGLGGLSILMWLSYLNYFSKILTLLPFVTGVFSVCVAYEYFYGKE